MTTANREYQPKELIAFSQASISKTGVPADVTPLFTFVAGSKSNDGMNRFEYSDQLRATLSFLNQNGYDDRINYRQYRSAFVQLIRGDAVQTREDVADNVASTVAKMDKATLARFSSFLQHEEKFEFGFMAKRAADGTLAAVVHRAYVLGPNKAPEPAPVAAVA